MRRWSGFLGSWALLVLGLGILVLALAGEWINVKDARKLLRYSAVEALLGESEAGHLERLRQAKGRSESSRDRDRESLAGADRSIDETQDSAKTVIVSTSENKVYVRDHHLTVFTAVCSTGMHATLIDGGRTLVFRTPVGKFKVRSKEQHPIWIPPDWHYVELARKSGRKVVRLSAGQVIDADTGRPADQTGGGVWKWIGDSGRSRRLLTVRNNSVIEVSDGSERELPPGAMILAGNAVVIPPIGSPQRRFDKVLGAYRLNLGDGYALHGTQATGQLGRSVSHGCVRLGDADIARLYKLVNVGDQVIIY